MRTWTERCGEDNRSVDIEHYELDRNDYEVIAKEHYKQFSNRLECEYLETYPLIPITENLVIEYEDVLINEPTVNFTDMEIDERCTCNELASYFNIETGRSYCKECR